MFTQNLKKKIEQKNVVETVIEEQNIVALKKKNVRIKYEFKFIPYNHDGILCYVSLLLYSCIIPLSCKLWFRSGKEPERYAGKLYSNG